MDDDASASTPAADSPPHHIMVHPGGWDDWRWPFPTRAAFAAAIQASPGMEEEAAAAAGVEGPEPLTAWQPHQPLLRAQRVRVRFDCWDEGAHEQRGRCLNRFPTGPTRCGVLEVSPDNGNAFTPLEMLHKVCFGIARHLHRRRRSLLDYRFLELLQLDLTRSAPGVPTYTCWFGS